MRQAIREGNDGEMRDLARLAIAAFGRQGEGSGVVGVDVQRIRRTLGLQTQPRGAEGEEQARRIRAEADREARVIVANARRDSEIARGEGDAKAARIYADAYAVNPDLYALLRSLQAYQKTLNEGTTLVLSPRSEFFRYLDGAGGGTPRSNGAAR